MLLTLCLCVFYLFLHFLLFILSSPILYTFWRIVQIRLNFGDKAASVLGEYEFIVCRVHRRPSVEFIVCTCVCACFWILLTSTIIIAQHLPPSNPLKGVLLTANWKVKSMSVRNIWIWYLFFHICEQSELYIYIYIYRHPHLQMFFRDKHVSNKS